MRRLFSARSLLGRSIGDLVTPSSIYTWRCCSTGFLWVSWFKVARARVNNGRGQAWDEFEYFVSFRVTVNTATIWLFIRRTENNHLLTSCGPSCFSLAQMASTFPHSSSGTYHANCNSNLHVGLLPVGDVHAAVQVSGCVSTTN